MKKGITLIPQTNQRRHLLFCILACINFSSQAYDSKVFAETGFQRILFMSVMPVVSVIVTLAILVLYFLKIIRMKSLRARYFAVSLCCVFICSGVILRGIPYIQDLKEVTSVVVTKDYWYYMGSGEIEFTDQSGNKQVVSANYTDEMNPLIFSQFFENDKDKIYIKYYPHTGTVVDIHVIK